MNGDTPQVIAGDKVVGCRSGVAEEFEGAVVSIGVLQSISMEPAGMSLVALSGRCGLESSFGECPRKWNGML